MKIKTICYGLLALAVLAYPLFSPGEDVVPGPMYLGGPDPAGITQTLDSFDHGEWDELLQRFVDCRGLVAYQSWKADAQAQNQLLHYLVSLGQVDVHAPAARDSKLAFYINAYNALAIWGVLEGYPRASIQLMQHSHYHVFDDLQLWWGGQYLSLNGMENKILRPLGEPRIHFALVCAARGCPRLRCQAYRAGLCSEQLSDNAVDFFASPLRFQLCRKRNTVWLSPILKWYGSDFGSDEHALLTAILDYLPCSERQWLETNPCCKVRFLGYDWGLNDQCSCLKAKLGRLGFTLYGKLEPRLGPLVHRSHHHQHSSQPTPSVTTEPASRPAGDGPSLLPPPNSVEGSGSR